MRFQAASGGKFSSTSSLSESRGMPPPSFVPPSAFSGTSSTSHSSTSTEKKPRKSRWN